MAATLIVGDCRTVLSLLPSGSVQTVVTSPPYFGLRSYGTSGEIGLEPTPQAYVAAIVDTFRLVRNALSDYGTVWLNLGDCFARDQGKSQHKPGSTSAGKHKTVYYTEDGGGRAATEFDLKAAGFKPKDLIGVPWMVAFALRDDGWYLRNEIIWNKPNGLPDSVKDRCVKSHETIFLLSKSEQYYFDYQAVEEPRVDGKGTRRRRSVWTVNTRPRSGAGVHFSAYPPELITPCILAGAAEGSVVLDPFCGSGTTGVVALKYGRWFVGIDSKAKYVAVAEQRIAEETGHKPAVVVCDRASATTQRVIHCALKGGAAAAVAPA